MTRSSARGTLGLELFGFPFAEEIVAQKGDTAELMAVGQSLVLGLIPDSHPFLSISQPGFPLSGVG